MKIEEERRIASQTAKTLAMMCIRNSDLEKLHAGTAPITKTGDYSDVKIIDAEGREIPWLEVSHIDQTQMKSLMKQVVNSLYTWLTMHLDFQFADDLNAWIRQANKWDDPEIDQDFIAKISKR